MTFHENTPVTMTKDKLLANNAITQTTGGINMLLGGHLQKKNRQTYHAPADAADHIILQKFTSSDNIYNTSNNTLLNTYTVTSFYVRWCGSRS